MHHQVPTAAQDDASYSAKPGVYAWIVFALVFGLMLSDYMSRQVMNAIFPFLKNEWALTDTQLGSLVSVVALTVGLMSFPISLVADRVGRVKSATVMALMWGLATIACGLSGNFMMMFIARAFVGLGEAGYGGAGAAILAHVFPPRMHAMILGSFLAAGLFGSVLGVALGGMIAAQLGWKMAFILIGGGGLVLALIFPLVVREPPASRAANVPRLSLKEVVRELFATRTAICAYLGAGFSFFVTASLLAWLPSYLNRYHGMDPGKAAVHAGILVLIAGVGMVVGGGLVDRLSRKVRRNRLRIPALFALASALFLLVAFQLPPGTSQFILIAAGLFVGAGFAGPSSAVVADMTNAAIHATVFATATLINNLVGLAPGPFVTGLIADHTSLQTAMKLVPLMALVSAAIYFIGAKSHDEDRRRLHR